jgi:2'-5' RNA ligase
MVRKLCPIIAYFEEKVEKEIKELQKEIYYLTGAQASLNEWRPHITVGKALHLDETSYSQILSELNSFTKGFSTFKIELRDFGFIDNWKGSKLFSCKPYVVYINVVLNSNLIAFVEKLDEILKKYNYRYDIFPYNPHVTLSFKDLDKEGFLKTKKLLEERTFSKIVSINGFSMATDKHKKGEFVETENFRFLK